MYGQSLSSSFLHYAAPAYLESHIDHHSSDAFVLHLAADADTASHSGSHSGTLTRRTHLPDSFLHICQHGSLQKTPDRTDTKDGAAPVLLKNFPCGKIAPRAAEEQQVHEACSVHSLRSRPEVQLRVKQKRAKRHFFLRP